jgi:ABC-type transport system substrate-binding protein
MRKPTQRAPVKPRPNQVQGTTAQAIAATITSGRGFGNPSYLDAQIKAAAALPLGAARTKAYEDIQKILVEQPVHLITNNQYTNFAATTKVVGLDKMVYGHISTIMDIRGLAVTK